MVYNAASLCGFHKENTKLHPQVFIHCQLYA